MASLDETSVPADQSAGGDSSDTTFSAAVGDVAAAPDTQAETASEETGADSEELSDEEAALAFAQCMRDQGVDFPDPSVDSDGRLSLRLRGGPQGSGPFAGLSREEVQELVSPCSQFLEAIVGQADRPDPAEREDDLLEFAQCVREGGFELPDPDFTSGGNPFGDLDFRDPDFQAAAEDCQSGLGRPGPGGFGRGGGGSPDGGG